MLTCLIVCTGLNLYGGEEAPVKIAAPDPDEEHPATYLKRLPLESLVDVEITSVSRRPEPLSLAPSAIDVLTSEDIRRSGVNHLPDLFRLATGVHVAQVNGSSWAISARGFNTVLFNNAIANKMQVLMDGRSLYTPLFSGVFWDVQHTFLPDIEQVEIIRGPGATLWGANAVNGVINIRTKSSKDTLGGIIQSGFGVNERGFGGARYGGKIGNTTYRVYGTHLNRDSLHLEGGGDAQDDLSFTKGGFRLDSDLSPDDLLTVQGDIYTGRFGQFGFSDIQVDGGNLLGRWTRELGPKSNVMLQLYYDRTFRSVPGLGEETRNTFDLEWQHRFPVGESHDVIIGLNYRNSSDRVSNDQPGIAFLPNEDTLHLISAYVQDEIQLIKDRLSLTLGSKFENNSLSGFEIQPSGRLALRIDDQQTLWTSVSRAVRNPTRADYDIISPNPATGFPAQFRGDDEYGPEKLIAYELGYRIKPSARLSFDLALFYNDYEDIRSQEPPTTFFAPAVLDNKQEAQAYGAELAVKWQPTDWWQINTGYTIFETNVRAVDGGMDTTAGAGEANDPNHMLVVRSIFDLPGDIEFDATLRYVDRLPNPYTSSYVGVDLRLAWVPRPDFELAVVGRNLLDDNHPEFRQPGFTREVGRSVYGMITWRF